MKTKRLGKNLRKRLAYLMAGALMATSVICADGTEARAAGRSYDNIRGFLGSAFDYGIVAESMNQISHMQTNFAVISYSNPGQYTGDDITGHPGYIVTGNTDVTIPLNDGAKNTVICQGTTPDGGKDVSGYVSGMIQTAAGNLAGASANFNLPEVNDQNHYTVDITSGGSVVYLNMDGVYSKVALGGLDIKMNAGQTAVVILTGSSASLGRYQINGQSSTNNADRVIWYLPNATSVNISEVGGAIVAPKASAVIGSTSYGWLIAKSVQNNGGEWHKVNPTESEGAASTVTPSTPDSSKDDKNSGSGDSGQAGGEQGGSGDAGNTSNNDNKTDDGSKTTDDGSKKTDDGSKTTDDGSKKTDDGSKKTDDGSKKTDDSSKKTDDSSKKTDDSSKKTDGGSKKTDDSSKKTDGGSKKTDDSSKKTDDSSKITDDSSKKTDDSSKTTDDGNKTDGGSNDSGNTSDSGSSDKGSGSSDGGSKSGDGSKSGSNSGSSAIVNIDDETTPLAATPGASAKKVTKKTSSTDSDKAVLGASRRPQTGDDATLWNIGFVISLAALSVWLLKIRTRFL